MKKITLFLGLIIGSFICFSCGNAQKPEADQAASKQLSSATVSGTKDVYPLFKAYWAAYNFRDTAILQQADQAEQLLVDYINLFPALPIDSVRLGVKAMLTEAAVEPKVLAFFVEKYAHYLYDPNSPMRNDQYYEPVLEFLLAAKTTDATAHTRYASLLKLLRKNMPGTVAADFSYLNTLGAQHTLHQSGEGLRLLVFYDPGCMHCAAIIEQMRSSEILNQQLAAHKLSVLAICPVADQGSWEAYIPSIPAAWTNGFDIKKQVIEGELYDIKAFPTLFLLDQNNKVILKDADWQQVEAVFK